ncbi:MAG: hybrid sensor histidine kinase/response regulator [Limisphaerales bacterium]
MKSELNHANPAPPARGNGSVWTDATELEHVEDQLAESEERYRILVENSPDAIQVQSDGVLLYVSPAAMRLYGAKSPRELVGTSVVDRIHPDDRRAVADRVRQIQELGALALPREQKILRLDGEVVIVEATGAPIEYQGRPAVQMVLRDVTERKRSEAALQESERRFAAFINSSCALAWMKDEHYRYVYVNEPFERAFKIKAADINGKSDFELWPEATAQAIREHDAQVLNSWKSYDTHETLPTPDGEAHHLWVFKFPFRDAARRRFVAGMAVDITERKRLEQQLLQSQKMESVGRLAGGIAHDFNNLLQGILGYSTLLLEYFGPEDPRREDMREIIKAAESAGALTHQLLAYSRRQVLQPKVLSLNNLVRDLNRLLGRLIGEDIELTTQLDEATGPVKADPSQLQQVIVNLAINARDAMPRGGRLTLATANVDLDEAGARKLTGLAPGRYVLLTVSDTGSGMPPDVQTHIFEPFFTTKELGKGTGLGLSTVYGVVKQSGGDIRVESQVGESTTFRIYLPRVDEVVKPSPVLATATKPRGHETILLVEDDNSVRSLLRVILQTSGYKVMDAPHGVEALRVSQGCSAAPIDLLVTDVVMPKMGGRELAEQLAARRPGLKVLYLSGHTEDTVFRRGVQDAKATLLKKPFDSAAFLLAVRQVLDTATKN